MVRCIADSSLVRMEVEGFKFPLGVYPVGKMEPRAGFTLNFEPADGDEHDGEWEEWPDRYVYDIVISAERLESLVRLLFSLLPGQVFPIIDSLGHDAYREIDPYMAYDLVPLEVVADEIRRFRDFFYEDGMCGFGVMSERPFFYVFVDEHKIVTLRVEPTYKEKVDKILRAFDLEQMEEPAGADGASHEHRTVLLMPEDKPELLGGDEIVERLRDQWDLVLNINPDTNVDDEGKPLGTVPWRCVVRVQRGDTRRKSKEHYAEVLLYADCLHVAEQAALSAAEQLVGGNKPAIEDAVIIAADRITDEMLAELLEETPKKKKGKGVKVLAGGEVSGTVKSSKWLD